MEDTQLVNVDGGFAAPTRLAAPDHAPLRLRNGRIRLRPAEPSDVGFLAELMGHEDISYRWTYRGRVPTEEQVRLNLTRPHTIQMMVEGLATGERIGLCVAYDVNDRNGRAKVGGVVTAQAAGSGVGLSALLLLVDYLFTVQPLRKVYFESIEYTFQQYRSLVKRGFATVEGIFREYEYFAGRYWDFYTVSMTREQFGELRKIFAGRDWGLSPQ